MFTLEQVKEAHSRVKSGTDFPKYIQDISKLGVISYETHPGDGNTIYYGANHYQLQSGPKFKPMSIRHQIDKEQFLKDLKATQSGKTDYPTFCSDSAKSGVEKWVVDIAAMICTYYDKSGKPVATEAIPGV